MQEIANIINPDGPSRFFLICEHASHFIPAKYQNLGLSQNEIERHIGWDIGAQAMAIEMSKQLNAPLVLQTQSRLLYDCNRPPSAKSAIPQVSESTVIIGNCDLNGQQRKARADDIYYPFHNSISKLLDKRAAEIDSVIVTLHSFNPTYKGQTRSLDIGFINDQDASWSRQLTLCANAQHDQLNVAQNEPYSAADDVTHTLALHGTERQLPNVMIEVKNSLIDHEAGQIEFATLLAQLLKTNLPSDQSTQGDR